LKKCLRGKNRAGKTSRDNDEYLGEQTDLDDLVEE